MSCDKKGDYLPDSKVVTMESADEQVLSANNQKAVKQTRGVSMDSIYQESLQQIDELYRKLFVFAIKYQLDLCKASKYATRYLLDKTHDKKIEDFLFFSLVTSLLDVSIGQICAVTEKDAMEVLDKVISELKNESHHYHIQKEEQYFEEMISFHVDRKKLEKYISPNTDGYDLPEDYTAYNVAIEKYEDDFG